MRSLLLLILASSPAAADKGLVARLAWLPSDTQSVSGSPPRSSPIFGMVPSALGPKTPACYEGQLAAFDNVLQIWNGPLDRSPFLFHGSPSRDALEACFTEVLTAIGMRAKLAREGALTVVSFDSGKRFVVGYGAGWIVQADDRARVELVLAALSKPHPHVNLDGFLAQVDPTTQMWGVSMVDYTRAVVGVPSLGFYTNLRDKSSLSMVFVFAAAKEANRALGKIAERSLDPALDPSLRAALRAAGAKVNGHTLSVNIAPFMEPAAMKALEVILQRAAD